MNIALYAFAGICILTAFVLTLWNLAQISKQASIEDAAADLARFECELRARALRHDSERGRGP